jgi:hypothetical protein
MLAKTKHPQKHKTTTTPHNQKPEKNQKYVLA